MQNEKTLQHFIDCICTTDRNFGTRAKIGHSHFHCHVYSSHSHSHFGMCSYPHGNPMGMGIPFPCTSIRRHPCPQDHVVLSMFFGSCKRSLSLSVQQTQFFFIPFYCSICCLLYLCLQISINVRGPSSVFTCDTA